MTGLPYGAEVSQVMTVGRRLGGTQKELVFKLLLVHMHLEAVWTSRTRRCSTVRNVLHDTTEGNFVALLILYMWVGSRTAWRRR